MDAVQRLDWQNLEGMSPQEVLCWAFRTYGEKLAVACSFGGLSGMVILHMLHEIGARPAIYYLDTDLLFPETYECLERVRERYGIDPIRVSTELSLPQQEAECGPRLWERDPDRCCHLRKVLPQKLFLKQFDAWVSGIRRDQSSSRVAARVIGWDNMFELVKINPLVTWTEQMVQAYVHAHEIPYNALNDRGYSSIGCMPCTHATFETGRGGRWRNFAKTECGLHGHEGVK
jgi:phosphoadenosine phosphosulfate reductase